MFIELDWEVKGVLYYVEITGYPEEWHIEKIEKYGIDGIALLTESEANRIETLLDNDNAFMDKVEEYLSEESYVTAEFYREQKIDHAIEEVIMRGRTNGR